MFTNFIKIIIQKLYLIYSINFYFYDYSFFFNSNYNFKNKSPQY